MPIQRIHRVSASRGLRSEVARLRGELAMVRGVLRQMTDQFAVAFPPAPPGGPISAWRGRIDLRERRLAQGWSQMQMIARIRAVATEDGLVLPPTETLKVMVSRWENRGGVGDFYARILHRVFLDAAPVPSSPNIEQTVEPAPAVPVAVDTDMPVTRWTGRHANALRQSQRLTQEGFAQVLGVALRTVAKWCAQPSVVPHPEMQRALDTLLSRSTPEQRFRFAQLSRESAQRLVAVA